MEILTLTLNFGVVAFKFNHKLVCKSCRLFKISAFNLPKEPHFEETLLLLKSLLAREKAEGLYNCLSVNFFWLVTGLIVVRHLNLPILVQIVNTK